MRAFRTVNGLTMRVLMIGFALTGCWSLSDERATVPEVTESAGLKIDESHIRVAFDGGGLEVRLPLARTVQRAFQGVLQVELVNLDGDVLDSHRSPFSLAQDQKVFEVQLSGLPASIDLKDLAGYLIHYYVEWESHALFGSRSAYAAAEKLEAQVMAPDKLYQGEQTFLRVLTRDPGTGEVRPDIPVSVALQMGEQTISLGSGKTDPAGTAEVLVSLPSQIHGQGQLLVMVENPDGTTESVQGSVEVFREQKILLTTDKPVYQPGQLIHMRALALKRPELDAVAGEPVVFEVKDGKGNKVFKQHGQTDEFGIASATFKLAGEVNMGGFEISATVGDTQSFKTVEVKRYALPKFQVTCTPDRGYYLPGERVTGQIQARYFFGKPVSHGHVLLEVFAFDVGLNKIGEVEGELNEEGLFGFAYTLPAAFAGVDLLQGDAYLQFDATVKDLAEHEEKVSLPSVVAQSPLKVSVVPESGDLVAGVENVLYVVTADPVGMPVPAEVMLSADGLPSLQVTTDARGFGQALLTPPAESIALLVQARDARGNEVEKTIDLVAGQGSVVLLRVDRRLYQVGDTARLSVWVNDVRDRIYLDVIKGAQTLLTHTVDLKNGQAVFEMELTPAMEGNLQFDAYYLTPESQIVRDTQLVLVQGARDLNLAVTLDQDVYQPAGTAQVSLSVTEPDGRGVPAAIGLSVVDEAVFALTDMRPGMAEVFFEIEQDVLKPRYQIVSSSALGDYLNGDLDSARRETAASIVFAAAKGFGGYGIEENTYVEAVKGISAMLVARVDQDVTAIVEAIRAAVEVGLVTEENLQPWLEKRAERWADPFGQPYRPELVGTDYWSQQIVFHSAGPDELFGSPDDVKSTAQPVWQLFYRQGGYDDDMAIGDGNWAPEAGDAAMDPNAPPGECPGGDCGTPSDSGGGAEGQEPPRVRSFFPETLYFNPAVITDADGKAQVEIPLADSITTWRMTSLANTMDGKIGSRADGIRVFQDFFVDVDFPATLTRGDQVSVPVAVYNYLDRPQSVRLEIQAEPWFSLLDAAQKTVSLDAGQVGVEYFTVAVDDVGWHGLTVFGYGEVQSDAVRRTVQIVPDGKEIRDGRSDRLSGIVTRTVSIPEEAIDGASRIFVKVYPGLMSQAVEGLDALLRIPNGCFEQTTTTAWPNILVLKYLQQSGQLTPEIELKARDMVSMSYQRILTFECPSGGFNWWVGDDPGNAILSAMALMMFADARDAIDLDMDVVGRTQQFLVSEQQSDGSWSGESHLHAGNEVYGETGIRASAFCTWGLAMSDYQGAALDSAAAYLRNHVGDSDDLYSLALVANALAWVDPTDSVLRELLADLESQKKVTDDGAMYWEAQRCTASGATGQNGNIETTAMIAQAFMKTGMYLDVAQAAITWMIQQKDQFGTWYSTQPTIQSLRAMSMAFDLATEQDVYGSVRVDINGQEAACTFQIDPQNSDVTRICELDAYTTEGDNTVTVILDGEGSFLYQVVGVYYLPWDQVAGGAAGPLSIDVTYDRTQLAVDDTVNVAVTVTYNIPDEVASMVMIDLGIPPGFTVMTEDLTELVQTEPHVTRYEMRGRQLSIYVDELANGTPLSFDYRMKADYPIHGACPESAVWAYYNPDVRDESAPVDFDVVP